MGDGRHSEFWDFLCFKWLQTIRKGTAFFFWNFPYPNKNEIHEESENNTQNVVIWLNSTWNIFIIRFYKITATAFQNVYPNDMKPKETQIIFIQSV